MLGQTMIGNHWNWVCHGKHLVAGDYFTVGERSPLANAFCGWVNKGYDPLLAKKERNRVAISWRFWAKSPVGHNLVCGIIKSSCDRLGRPFPLLLLGIGRLRGWPKHWELLPGALEPTWGQLEQFAAKRFQSFEQLKGDLQRFKRPRCSWSELQAAFGSHPQPDISAHTGSPTTEIPNIQELYAELQANRKVLMSLSRDSSSDAGAIIKYFLSCLKQTDPAAPNVVFMGGDIDKPSLAIFMDALHPCDFTTLWPMEVDEEDRINETEGCKEKTSIY
jgi:type VI secretion system ImpM family protein